MSIENQLKEKRDEILQIAERYGAFNVRVFGSVARGEAGAESDVDFLVELKKDWGLLDHIGMILDLEDLLDRQVDIAVEKWLRAVMRERILSEAVVL